ncbi:hypothetical protein F2Q70_00038411 [Brassica cretica]|uniref:Uncharacterized protein n=2 Tax=Brassica TaxID=3705 RepID=A0A8S9K411_BRACR|nr:hypothetical protein F2Q70_00038411 [Brassica cretica]KAG2281938.1 hypothetical protein Bca52824_053158 [Brassica carinata]
MESRRVSSEVGVERVGFMPSAVRLTTEQLYAVDLGIASLSLLRDPDGPWCGGPSREFLSLGGSSDLKIGGFCLRTAETRSRVLQVIHWG